MTDHPLEAPRLHVGAILKAIEDRRMTAVDAIDAARRRIAAGDSEIGAFVCLAEDDARQSTEAPLAGISIGVKDIFDTHDMPTEMGSPLYEGHRPRFDAALVAMARSAGATIIGKTVTTELASIDPKDTRNPVAPSHTPGGSSSGSAAAVAAGFVSAAFGSQTGGSVIRPASFCGIAGFKPSFRLLPTVGMKTFSWSLDTAGVFAASVADLALLAERITGRPLTSLSAADANGLRIGLYRAKVDDHLDHEMTKAIGAAARLLERAGARIVDLAEPAALSEGRDSHGTIQGFEAARALMHEHVSGGDRLGPKLRAILDEGATVEPDAYDGARRCARLARKAATSLFETVDALLVPSASGPPPAGLASTGDPTMAKLWTLTGNPVVNVPGLTTSAGLPLGVSIVTRFGRDREALTIADCLERLIQADRGRPSE